LELIGTLQIKAIELTNKEMNKKKTILDPQRQRESAISPFFKGSLLFTFYISSKNYFSYTIPF
ncbi:MAG: hypothetical protein ACP5Q3_15745, partial [bacterium]